MSKGDFSIELEGTEELQKFFSGLPKEFTDQALGDIAQKGASVIRAEARRQMPIDGELGKVGKKAVIIARNPRNKTERDVKIGSQYILFKGAETSLGKIIRHMTAGYQNNRKTKKGENRGKVGFRLGDFIQKAFSRKSQQAIQVMNDSIHKVIEKRVNRTKGMKYER